MRNLGRTALRAIVAFAFLSLSLSVITPPAAVNSPYASALSSFSIQPALAKNNCTNKGCVGGGHHHLNCAPLDGYVCTNLPGSCFHNVCPTP